MNIVCPQEEDLLAVLDELERLVTDSRNRVATSPANKLNVTAEFVDDLECIVSDVVEYLGPHIAEIKRRAAPAKQPSKRKKR